MSALSVRRPLGCLKAVMRQARVQRQLRSLTTETTPPAAEHSAEHSANFRLCTSQSPAVSFLADAPISRLTENFAGPPTLDPFQC